MVGMSIRTGHKVFGYLVEYGEYKPNLTPGTLCGLISICGNVEGKLLVRTICMLLNLCVLIWLRELCFFL